MAPSIRHLSLAVLLAAVLQLQTAGADNTDGKGKYSHCDGDSSKLCMDSFVWCALESDNCDFPNNTYDYLPGDPRQGSINVHIGIDNPALVLWDHDYNLTWQNSDADQPMTLIWGTYKYLADPNFELWSKTFKHGERSIIINFSDLAAKPNKEFHLDYVGIQANVSFGLSYFEISQNRNNKTETDKSDPFAVFSNNVFSNDITRYLDTQRELGKKEGKKGGEKESNDDGDDDGGDNGGDTGGSSGGKDGEETYNRWRLGVGIGLGIGIPVLAALSFLGGWLYGKRSTRKDTPALAETTSDEAHELTGLPPPYQS